MKVVELVLNHREYGWSPEELQLHHPYLTMGQIHSALGFYWDNRAEMDADIERRFERTEALRAAAPGNAFVERLRRIKSLDAR